MPTRLGKTVCHSTGLCCLYSWNPTLSHPYCNLTHPYLTGYFLDRLLIRLHCFVCPPRTKTTELKGLVNVKQYSGVVPLASGGQPPWQGVLTVQINILELLYLKNGLYNNYKKKTPQYIDNQY